MNSLVPLIAVTTLIAAAPAFASDTHPSDQNKQVATVKQELWPSKLAITNESAAVMGNSMKIQKPMEPRRRPADQPIVTHQGSKP